MPLRLPGLTNNRVTVTGDDNNGGGLNLDRDTLTGIGRGYSDAQNPFDDEAISWRERGSDYEPYRDGLGSTDIELGGESFVIYFSRHGRLNATFDDPNEAQKFRLRRAGTDEFSSEMMIKRPQAAMAASFF